MTANEARFPRSTGLSGLANRMLETRARAATRFGMALAMQCALAGVCFVLLISGWNSSTGDHIWALSVLFTVISAWSFGSWHLLTGRILDAYFLFLLSFVLFSGGQLLLHAIGALPYGPLSEVCPSNLVEQTILIVNTSLAMVHLGALLWVFARPAEGGSRKIVYDVGRLRSIGVAFVAASLPALLFGAYDSVHTVATSGYGSLYGQPTKTGLANLSGFLSMFLTPGLLVLLGTMPRSKLVVRFVWAVALAKAASLLFVGQRGYAVMTLAPMLLLHDRVVRPVNRTLAIGLAAAALLVVFPLVRSLRSLDARERMAAVRSGVDVEDPLTNTISEMGGSMRTIAHTIELVPLHRPYDYGEGLLRAGSTLIPNLFWDRHPGAAGNYGEWLVRRVSPWAAEVGGGLGFSMIAEGYINFGPFGAPIYCGVVGMLFAAMLVGLGREQQSPEIIFGTVVLSVILFYPRSEASAMFRVVVWCALLPYLLTSRRLRAGS